MLVVKGGSSGMLLFCLMEKGGWRIEDGGREDGLKGGRRKGRMGEGVVCADVGVLGGIPMQKPSPVRDVILVVRKCITPNPAVPQVRNNKEICSFSGV